MRDASRLRIASGVGEFLHYNEIIGNVSGTVSFGMREKRRAGAGAGARTKI